jgi:NADPH-dependent curcumin reductase CurA
MGSLPMTETNRRWVLAGRPVGAPQLSDFRFEEGPMAVPGAGEVLCRTIYQSLDPYMRGRMNASRSYAKPVEIGEVMTAETVGQVVRSRADGLTAGDIVLGMGGWQSHWALPAGQVRKVDPARAPLPTRLGVLGMPGLTAYGGLLEIGKLEPGETVVVAAASGAVGSVVGQIARIKGARAVGIAGGAEKCAYVRDELGFDAAVDHRAGDMAAALAGACPDGVDIYFENVGGAVLEAAWPLLNPFARVPVCGTIAHANATALPEGPNKVPQMMRDILVKRLTVRGFLVYDFEAIRDRAMADLEGWVGDGRLKHREDIVDGLENAPEAFIGLLEGRNFGKLIVRVSPDPIA